MKIKIKCIIDRLERLSKSWELYKKLAENQKRKLYPEGEVVNREYTQQERDKIKYMEGYIKGVSVCIEDLKAVNNVYISERRRHKEYKQGKKVERYGKKKDRKGKAKS